MAPPALPNLTFTVTPPNHAAINYTTKLAFSGASQQIGITQNFGRQGDTATFVLVDDWSQPGQSGPSLVIPPMSQVKLVDNTAGQTLFAGVCHTPQLSPVSVTRNEWLLACTDYTFYADNAIVHGTFVGQTVDQIIVSLTAQASCGISAASVHSGGFVAPGPTIADFVLNYTTLSEAWRKLASLAAQVTPYGWYVDENRRLHFYDSTTALPSGVTFTTSPTSSGAGSLTEAHFDWDQSSTYEWDGSSVRNRSLVQGANQTIPAPAVTKAPTDTWIGNGGQTAWPLKYTVTGSPILKVNGVQQAVTVVGAGATASGTWQIQQNAFGGYFLTNTVGAPAAGVKIQIWYSYLVPIVMRANDTASQHQYNGPNGGVFVEYILDTSLTTAPMALARAQRQRTEYAFAVERMTFNTTPEWFGWIRAGQTCTVTNQYVPDAQNNNTFGVTDTFLITGNTVSFGFGGYRSMQLTAVRL